MAVTHAAALLERFLSSPYKSSADYCVHSVTLCLDMLARFLRLSDQPGLYSYSELLSKYLILRRQKNSAVKGEGMAEQENTEEFRYDVEKFLMKLSCQS